MRSDEQWFGLTATNNRPIALEQLHKATCSLCIPFALGIFDICTPKTQLVNSEGLV